MNANENIDKEVENLNLKKISLEIAKLEAETANLKNNSWDNKVTRLAPVMVPIVVAAISVASFWAGTFIQQGFEMKKLESQQKVEMEKLNVQQQLSEKEFRRNIYVKQLETYTDISQTAVAVSLLDDNNKIQENYRHFVELYNGNLVIFAADTEVIKAAKDFDDIYNKYKSNQTSKDELKKSARVFSIACRKSLLAYWNVPMSLLTTDDLEK
jgi:hypothetical protein